MTRTTREHRNTIRFNRTIGQLETAILHLADNDSIAVKCALANIDTALEAIHLIAADNKIDLMVG